MDKIRMEKEIAFMAEYRGYVADFRQYVVELVQVKLQEQNPKIIMTWDKLSILLRQEEHNKCASKPLQKMITAYLEQNGMAWEHWKAISSFADTSNQVSHKQTSLTLEEAITPLPTDELKVNI
jgi:hypothetical protein